ncbi:MAG: ATP-binding protein [Burkholderiales bacterium]
MRYIARDLARRIAAHLGRGKSVLLFGPRQTGKTTLAGRLPADMRLSLVPPEVRQRYERAPAQLAAEIEALRTRHRAKRPIVVLDEVQRVPALLDVVQDAIDRKLARFVLTGSSARKLRRGGSVNLLPGRVVTLRLDPLNLRERPEPNLRSLLLHGSLPGIRAEPSSAGREIDLRSYVETYLEEEVRAEALVRNVGTFARFLELAGLESGNIVSFRALSQELGIAHTTVAGFYEILEDCLVAERVDPLTRSRTRKKLTKSSRYLIFDLGVRRLCANEGTRPHRDRLGQLFEQFVGLELIRQSRSAASETRVLFWRDPDGPEVDWIVEHGEELLPVEVKWTDAPGARDARHVETFLDEYREARRGFIVCRAPRLVRISKRVTALPWQELGSVLPA